MPMMAKSAKTTDEHKQELIEDIKRNDAADSVRTSIEYLHYTSGGADAAARLAALSNPVWVVHAEEKGDGGLTDAERAILEAAANVTVVTIPGAVFLLPDEEPRQVAEVIAAAVAAAR